ncbi:uncharacterized protein LOC132800721 [Ziziphus jujuba]|uniref:Uncharacterized protein LOC132800721 n=1 Tax=Ziziphus jujuba TaxID=326968 RepID=A0ABM4A2J5_ZIZJJ|nr:uncharacterized protein LOC132800721 [Ziziphus jujuba]
MLDSKDDLEAVEGDELLNESVIVGSVLLDKLWCLRESQSDSDWNGNVKDVSLFMMADTAYSSCCVDEVGASHINADYVVHHGHACFSPTTTLPAFFVFGKASTGVSNCVKNLSDHAVRNGKPFLVPFGLEYAHLIQHIRDEVVEACMNSSRLEIQFAETMSSDMNPSESRKISNGSLEAASVFSDDKCIRTVVGNRYTIGGLVWELHEEYKMEDYLFFWIGCGNAAFASVVLTLYGCEIDMMQSLIAW